MSEILEAYARGCLSAKGNRNPTPEEMSREVALILEDRSFRESQNIPGIVRILNRIEAKLDELLKKERL